jgi:hypothetical protein
MKIQWIKCKNGACDNRLRVQTKNIESKPILFCSDRCFASVVPQNEILDHTITYEDPQEIRDLVKNLLSQTKQLQNEVVNLRKIRQSYFSIFKENKLRKENYKRKWSFDEEQK